MFNTKFYKNRWRPLNFRRIWFFYFFFIVTSNYKNSMYPRSFLCGEAKIKKRTRSKKELCEIGEEAIWESRFTSFFTWNHDIAPFLLGTSNKCVKLQKKKNSRKTPLMSKEIERSLHPLIIYFILLFLKLISLPWKLVIGIGHRKLLSEITRFFCSNSVTSKNIWRSVSELKIQFLFNFFKTLSHPYNIFVLVIGIRHSK